MSPPPVNPSGNQTTSSGEAQRSIPTPFLTKTYQIVDDPSIDDVISWNEDGSAFVVWNPTVFARDLLPKYFKHNNLSSFVRQLNTYGFRKVAPDRWEFANESFRRGERRLLCDIQRRKAPIALSPIHPATAVATACAAVTVTAIPITPPSNVSPTGSSDEQVTSNSPPTAIPTASVCRGNDGAVAGWSSSCSNNNNDGGRVDLIDENERLKSENLELNRELSNMKSLCSNIFSLMSNYANPQTTNTAGGGYTEEADMLQPLELLRDDDAVGGSDNAVETTELSVGSQTRLFGFEIGSKRTREDTGGSGSGSGSMHLDDEMMMDVEVKSEPFDGSSGELDGDDHHQQQAPWIKRCHRQMCN